MTKVAAPRSSPKPFAERFADYNPGHKPEEALVEANRCLYCYDAPCIAACPTHIDIPRFIKQIATRNLAGSARTILEANPAGHSCSRVCPVEVLCEGSCVYHDWHEKPIEIARLQRFATDQFFYGKKVKLFRPGADNGRAVAIIGAGPAGLACAFYLRRLGHPVTLFERKPLPGGLNTYGIAEYKMDQRTALDETRLVLDMGADLRTGVEVGRGLPLDRLERDFEAVFIGIGLGSTTRLRVPGEDLPGVLDSLTFIAHIKNREPHHIPPGETTVVIGAGNTAIDAVTQAKRLGTPRVVMAYRRSEGQMSAYAYEYELAKSDAVEFLWNSAPKRILGKKRVEAVEFVRTRSEGGKLAEVRGSEFRVDCDRVITAIGQAKQLSLAKAAGLRLAEDGRILADPKTLRTSSPRYWAGGDAINGGKEVVNAAADGKRAAWDIHKTLCGTADVPGEHVYWVNSIDGSKATIAPRPLPDGNKRQS